MRAQFVQRAPRQLSAASSFDADEAYHFILSTNYAKMRRPTTDPPPDVECQDAVGAVRRYKPRIVIASWCTQLYKDGDTPQQIGASVYGITSNGSSPTSTRASTSATT